MKRVLDAWSTIRHNGGIWKCVKALYYRDDLKIGTLVGEDAFGNRYYENDKYFLPRNRWVNYSDKVRLEYDASQVPAEWHGWLHNRHARPPHEEPHRPRYPWMEAHSENMSGTSEQYVPYSTTTPKIIPWKPPAHRDESPCFVRPPPPAPPDGCPKPLGGPCSKPEPSSGQCGSADVTPGGNCGNTGDTPKDICGRPADKPGCEKPTKAFH